MLTNSNSVASKASPDVSLSPNPNNTETPERTRQHWCIKCLPHCCCFGSFWQARFLPDKVQLSHNKKILYTITYTKYNTTGREGTIYYGIFWGSCNLSTTDWHMCITLTATWDDILVRLQNRSSGKAEIAIVLKHCANIHLLSGAGFDCQWRNLDSVILHETQFNCGLGWTITVLADTPKPHSRWTQIVFRGPVLLISVAYFEMQYNFKLKWEIGKQGERFCFCG